MQLAHKKKIKLKYKIAQKMNCRFISQSKNNLFYINV